MPTNDRRMVFVLGPGRSGTSTMAGALAHSGYEVPQAIRGNETNPSGFYEPRWVVDFHRRLLDSTRVRTLDTDPEALERMQAVTGDEAVRAELRDWLAARLETHDRLVIKDPRMVWFRDLWVDVSRELGVDPGFVIMLRHPSEVSSSRSEYYNLRLVTGVAGWINVALLSEQLTSGSPRALVQYVDLLADWRPELVRAREQLDLRLEPAPEERLHPVDGFIDPGLRRMKPGWENIPVPGFLQDLGDRTFDALGALGQHGESPQTAELLDQLRAEYAVLHADALALVQPRVRRMREESARRSARRVRANARTRAKSPYPSPQDGPQRGSLRRAVVRRLGRGSRG